MMKRKHWGVIGYYLEISLYVTSGLTMKSEEPVFLDLLQKNLYAENAHAVMSQHSSVVAF